MQGLWEVAGVVGCEKSPSAVVQEARSFGRAAQGAHSAGHRKLEGRRIDVLALTPPSVVLVALVGVGVQGQLAVVRLGRIFRHLTEAEGQQIAGELEEEANREAALVRGVPQVQSCRTS